MRVLRLEHFKHSSRLWILIRKPVLQPLIYAIPMVQHSSIIAESLRHGCTFSPRRLGDLLINTFSDYAIIAGTITQIWMSHAYPNSYNRPLQDSLFVVKQWTSTFLIRKCRSLCAMLIFVSVCTTRATRYISCPTRRLF